MMDIKEQFNLIAKTYDSNRKRFIPCFDDFYGDITNLIAANIESPKKILDLGAGTGILSSFWYPHFPKAEYILVDIAEDMLDVAKKRFAGLHNISYRVMDYVHGLGNMEFDMVISALSIHHLENDLKQALFTQIYDNLPKKGMFINYDQFCVEDPLINAWINTYWESQVIQSGLSQEDIELWKERRKLDREIPVEKEIKMLRESGFEKAECIYTFQKFSVIAAIK